MQAFLKVKILQNFCHILYLTKIIGLITDKATSTTFLSQKLTVAQPMTLT
jgi:hypothetical protein